MTVQKSYREPGQQGRPHSTLSTPKIRKRIFGCIKTGLWLQSEEHVRFAEWNGGARVYRHTIKLSYVRCGGQANPGLHCLGAH